MYICMYIYIYIYIEHMYIYIYVHMYMYNGLSRQSLEVLHSNMILT